MNQVSPDALSDTVVQDHQLVPASDPKFFSYLQVNLDTYDTQYMYI